MKYKIGDRVLVEAKIEYLYNTENFYQFSTKDAEFDSCGSTIYSKLDHDFKPGELVEVRDLPNESWITYEFVCKVSNPDILSWVIYDEDIDDFCHFKYIRKTEQPESHDGKTALIDGQEYELKLKG
jgi:hypothetical protein